MVAQVFLGGREGLLKENKFLRTISRHIVTDILFDSG
jgi:hypothetical protein